MDSNTLILLLVAGGAAWYFLMGPGKSSTSASSSVSASSTSALGPPPAGSPPYTYTPNVTVGTARNSTTFDIMHADAGSLTFTLDGWGYWLKKALLAQGVIPAQGTDPMNPYPWNPPGCGQLSSDPSVCGTPIALDQYLVVAIPWLQKNGINANWGGGIIQTSQGPVWVSSDSMAMAGLSGVDAWAV